MEILCSLLKLMFLSNSPNKSLSSPSPRKCTRLSLRPLRINLCCLRIHRWSGQSQGAPLMIHMQPVMSRKKLKYQEWNLSLRKCKIIKDMRKLGLLNYLTRLTSWSLLFQDNSCRCTTESSMPSTFRL